jgi:hypothetical protein
MILVLSITGGLASFNALAEDVTPAMTLGRCAQLSDSLARLSCYDRIVGVSRTEQQSLDAVGEKVPVQESNAWTVQVIGSDVSGEETIVVSTPAMMWIGEICSACQSRLEIQCLAGFPSVIFRSPIELGKGELIFEAQHDSRNPIQQPAQAIDKGKGAVLMSASPIELTQHLFIHNRLILKLNRPIHPISAQFLISGLEQVLKPYKSQCGLLSFGDQPKTIAPK